MDQRRELVLLASQPGSNRRELARRWGVSAKTLYKWLDRYDKDGDQGLADLSRRPGTSPWRTPERLEQDVLALRDRYPYWGARKLAELLHKRNVGEVPAPSTIHAILRRHGRLDEGTAAAQKPFQRFEHPNPNDLWQMDFKGYVPNDHGRCHPLTILDDHSRFSLGLHACDDESRETVRARLIETFRCYGLPRRITMDNGPPWGCVEGAGYTVLTVWLMQLGITVSHSRPYHPQTQGKDERFHRTLVVELLQGRRFADNADAQRCFDKYRVTYNTIRPHQALGMATPIQRYRVSPVAYPEVLPVVEYFSTDRVYKVDKSARIEFKRRRFIIGKAFIGLRVALRPKAEDGRFGVWFSRFEIGEIDLRAP